MKATTLLAGTALASLAGLALWSGGNRSALAEVAAANETLRGRIAEAQQPNERGTAPAARHAGEGRRPTFAPGTIPWQRVEEWLTNEPDYQATFHHWTAREPQAAADWFDEKVGADWLPTRALDGIRRSRLEFETILFAASPDDPATAARLTRLPDRERDHLFSSVPDHRVRAIRDHLPPDHQARASARIAAVIHRRDGEADIGVLLDEAGLSAGVKRQVLHEVQPSKP